MNSIQDRKVAIDMSVEEGHSRENIPNLDPNVEQMFEERQSTVFLNIEPNFQDCVSCSSQKKTISTVCGHSYCLECLRELFCSTLKDRSLVPMRCCKIAFPLEIVKLVAKSEEEIEKYNRFMPGSDYNKPTPYIIQDEEELASVMKLAESEKWQKCIACNHLISLGYGCNHMTCICGAEWCYVCTRKWRECNCSLWDERRLIIEAENVVDRVFPGVPPIERANMILEVANDYRAREHRHHWTYQFNPNFHRCDICHRRKSCGKMKYHCGCGYNACQNCI
eukprot:TRINITY_DN2446_c0_g2_i1.p1 TRINITY_DN2446_c0_g2~~TRINITY_DN2446_c0_g2_i1.p1  ORF type:complete len:279 (+),score=5.79 TRINITY_DN2446_c0_g2_i1:419-1255(+)